MVGLLDWLVVDFIGLSFVMFGLVFVLLICCLILVLIRSKTCFDKFWCFGLLLFA